MSFGCGVTPTRPLRLPSPTEALEVRVAAYHELAGMPHRNMNGWRMRVGTGDVGDVDEARAVMQNAPEARRIFEDYDSTRRLGFGLMAGGLGAVLASPTLLLGVDRTGGSRADAGTVAGLSLMVLVGTVVSTIGAIVVGGTERHIPEATEAYNRWLWQRLALPTRAMLQALPEGAVPTPETGLRTQAPW